MQATGLVIVFVLLGACGNNIPAAGDNCLCERDAKHVQKARSDEDRLAVLIGVAEGRIGTFWRCVTSPSALQSRHGLKSPDESPCLPSGEMLSRINCIWEEVLKMLHNYNPPPAGWWQALGSLYLRVIMCEHVMRQLEKQDTRGRYFPNQLKATRQLIEDVETVMKNLLVSESPGSDAK